MTMSCYLGLGLCADGDLPTGKASAPNQEAWVSVTLLASCSTLSKGVPGSVFSSVEWKTHLPCAPHSLLSRHESLPVVKAIILSSSCPIPMQFDLMIKYYNITNIEAH